MVIYFIEMRYFHILHLDNDPSDKLVKIIAIAILGMCNFNDQLLYIYFLI